MRDMYGWLWDGILYRLNNISAEAANHCIKDKKYQEIINQVPHKIKTLVSIVLDSLWHLLQKMTNFMTLLILLFRFLSRNCYEGLVKQNRSLYISLDLIKKQKTF